MGINPKITEEEISIFDNLAPILVSYWKNNAIYAGVKFGIFDFVSNSELTIKELALKCKTNENGMVKLIHALISLGLLKLVDNKVMITKQGKLLTSNHPLSLAYASQLWNEEHYIVWRKIEKAIKHGKEIFSEKYSNNFFDWISENKEKSRLYQKALQAYAIRDYFQIPEKHDFSNHKIILDLGGGTGVLLRYLLEKYPKLNAILFEQEEVINIAKSSVLKDFLDRCSFISGDFFGDLSMDVDGIFLCRILHDWDDKSALKILNNCYNILEKNQYLYIVELILSEDLNEGFGALLNLNMQVMTLGKERTKREYQYLLQKSGFILEQIKETGGVSKLLIARKMG
ncbi:MAG: methyltransferase [Candidatus Heimdallarchaeaceae archaeon]